MEWLFRVATPSVRVRNVGNALDHARSSVDISLSAKELLATKRVVFRLAFDGKLLGAPLQTAPSAESAAAGPAGSVADTDFVAELQSPLSSFVYRISGASTQELASSLRERFVTMQVLLLTAEGEATELVMGSATASVYELLASDALAAGEYRFCLEVADGAGAGTYPQPPARTSNVKSSPRTPCAVTSEVAGLVKVSSSSSDSLHSSAVLTEKDSAAGENARGCTVTVQFSIAEVTTVRLHFPELSVKPPECTEEGWYGIACEILGTKSADSRKEASAETTPQSGQSSPHTAPTGDASRSEAAASSSSPAKSDADGRLTFASGADESSMGALVIQSTLAELRSRRVRWNVFVASPELKGEPTGVAINPRMRERVWTAEVKLSDLVRRKGHGTLMVKLSIDGDRHSTVEELDEIPVRFSAKHLLDAVLVFEDLPAAVHALRALPAPAAQKSRPSTSASPRVEDQPKLSRTTSSCASVGESSVRPTDRAVDSQEARTATAVPGNSAATDATEREVASMISSRQPPPQQQQQQQHQSPHSLLEQQRQTLAPLSLPPLSRSSHASPRTAGSRDSPVSSSRASPRVSRDNSRTVGGVAATSEQQTPRPVPAAVAQSPVESTKQMKLNFTEHAAEQRPNSRASSRNGSHEGSRAPSTTASSPAGSPRSAVVHDAQPSSARSRHSRDGSSSRRRRRAAVEDPQPPTLLFPSLPDGGGGSKDIVRSDDDDAAAAAARQRANNELTAAFRNLLAAYRAQEERARMVQNVVERLTQGAVRAIEDVSSSGDGVLATAADGGAVDQFKYVLCDDALGGDLPLITHLERAEQNVQERIEAEQRRMEVICERMAANTAAYKVGNQQRAANEKLTVTSIAALTEVEAELETLLANAEQQLRATREARTIANEEGMKAQEQLQEKERALLLLEGELHESVQRHDEIRHAVLKHQSTDAAGRVGLLSPTRLAENRDLRLPVTVGSSRALGSNVATPSLASRGPASPASSVGYDSERRSWRHFISSPMAAKQFSAVQPHPYSDGAGEPGRAAPVARTEWVGPLPATAAWRASGFLPEENLPSTATGLLARAGALPRAAHQQAGAAQGSSQLFPTSSISAQHGRERRDGSRQSPHPISALPASLSEEALSLRTPPRSRDPVRDDGADAPSALDSPLCDLEVQALLEAIEQGDRDVAMHLLRAKPYLVRRSNNPLHAACATRCAAGPMLDVVQTLLMLRPELARGIDVLTGNTALHFACTGNRLSPAVVRALLLAGVPTNVRNAAGLTAFHLAVQNHADEPFNRVKELLLTLSAPGTVDVDERTSDGQTALHLVCSDDASASTVKYLLDRGASVWAAAPVPNAGVKEAPVHFTNRPASGKPVRRELTPLERSREAGATTVFRMLEQAALAMPVHVL